MGITEHSSGLSMAARAAVVVLSWLAAAPLAAARAQQVTCGSVVKLMNQNHKVRLHRSVEKSSMIP